MMRYMASMNRRMDMMHRDVKKLNQRAWAEPEQRQQRRTIRSQLPCETIDQLQLLEDAITENSAAYYDLVSS